MRKPVFLFLFLFVLSACALSPTAEPEATATSATSEPAQPASTATQPPAAPTPTVPPATAAPTETATARGEEAVETPESADSESVSSIMTATPYPGARPTSGPLNAPMPTVGLGEYECGAYPCFDDAERWAARIHVPEGFTVRYVGLVEGNPTSLAFGPDGLLYIARQQGKIVTMDEAGNVAPFVDGFYHLVAIAFQPGSERLFAASRAEGDAEALIWVIEDGEARVLYDGLPCCYGGWHQANGIAFGPDGYGYVAVGALSDHGESGSLHPLEASVLRFDPDGGMIEPFATGLRNTFDIAWDSEGRLFGSDNMPDHGPPEEFNEIVAGGHHGFPYYEDCASCTPAPDDLEIVPPLHELLAHSAPTGLTVYQHTAFPGYFDNIFLTLWSAFGGAQKIVRFGPGGEGMTDFATGFAAPIDVAVDEDGALFVADWATGIVFEIAYSE